MLKRESSRDTTWTRVCDTCRSAACTVYCRADSAYLCASCDAHIHAANRMASRHERVWVCQACERSPAAFLCKADAASLCAACDSDIHSANPLARRHQRVPILPIPHGSAAHYGHASPAAAALACGDGHFFLGQGDVETLEEDEGEDEEDSDEAASWLLLNPVKHGNSGSNNNDDNNNINSAAEDNGFVFGGEADEYLDLVEYNSCTENQYSSDPYSQQHYSIPRKNHAGDSVVPEQFRETKDPLQHHHHHHQQSFQLSLDYEPMKSANSYNGSLCHSVSASSMDMRTVPESTMSDMLISDPRSPKGTIGLFSSPTVQIPTLLSPMDREARVLRYREKKKTRKFEKTIRYASRKAYAETRPRIKGRFAKRTEVDIEVDQIFSTTLMAGNEYGIVPSF
ncbi:hypothetical protein SAY87_008907 [Trapa incisa]|uniref:Uncharacterized protein n=1 Tax=Trapa incisa TaxID=236973 RepID=A0AAN7Q1L5_9MYRT|nr:hypothetical protein SAY87_008907 [Trapa incisa]